MKDKALKSHNYYNIKKHQTPSQSHERDQDIHTQDQVKKTQAKNPQKHRLCVHILENMILNLMEKHLKLNENNTTGDPDEHI